jgi:hypothetical protein
MSSAVQATATFSHQDTILMPASSRYAHQLRYVTMVSFRARTIAYCMLHAHLQYSELTLLQQAWTEQAPVTWAVLAIPSPL